MCGVIGAVSTRNVVPIIVEGLSRLEYRGYDSVGLAVINDGKLIRERVIERVKELQKNVSAKNITGNIGIGHTRWATHGGVTITNAHPHFSSNEIAIIHNGIIENYLEIKEKLLTKGYVFESETDTEVVAHLVHFHYKATNNLLKAVQQSIKELQGAYAIAVIATASPHEIVCAKMDSPLVLGIGEKEMLFASDIYPLLPITSKVVYLEDGDVAHLTLNGYEVYNNQGAAANREIVISKLSSKTSEMGDFDHFMQKEIFEQPEVIKNTIASLGAEFSASKFGEAAADIFKNITSIQIVSCGTSYFSGEVAKYWLEDLTGLPCSVDIASEFHYRNPAISKNALVITISQSGETADTMASLKYLQAKGVTNTLAICNVPESTLVRRSKLSILTKAGPEIGVASTKAFTTQLVVLLYLSYTIAKIKGRLTKEAEHKAIAQIASLPGFISKALEMQEHIKAVAWAFKDKNHALFLGRNTLFPIVSEGALKLKEISYIHAESYASGELKHGPLALVDENMPLVMLMPKEILADKVRSNVQEVIARKGQVYLFTDLDDVISKECVKTIKIDTQGLSKYLLPMVYVVPMQLLAYYTACYKGNDVDKPRNLAKSVTVE